MKSTCCGADVQIYYYCQKCGYTFFDKPGKTEMKHTNKPSETKTLRDEFALAILIGAYTNQNPCHLYMDNPEDVDKYHVHIYKLADSMLKAREAK